MPPTSDEWLFYRESWNRGGPPTVWSDRQVQGIRTGAAWTLLIDLPNLVIVENTLFRFAGDFIICWKPQ